MTNFAMTTSSLEKPSVETIGFTARPGTKEFLEQYRADTGQRSISDVLRSLIAEKALEYERANW